MSGRAEALKKPVLGTTDARLRCSAKKPEAAACQVPVPKEESVSGWGKERMFLQDLLSRHPVLSNS